MTVHLQQSCATAMANRVVENLGAEPPSLVKLMRPSHVSGGFWLGLERKFCVAHMPKQDATVILEDEGGAEYPTRYLVNKTGLSGGWRGFSIAHTLLTGDALVFQLVQPSKMKVYIVRSSGSGEVDGSLGLLDLNSGARGAEKTGAMKKRKTICSENDSEGSGSEVVEGVRLLESAAEFREVESMESFTIHVNGLVIDSEFSKHVRAKYYELCCSQGSFLHDRLLGGLNMKLAAGVISETINIADAIRAAPRVGSMPRDMDTWDRTLAAFETMGMKVGFLRAGLDELRRM